MTLSLVDLDDELTFLLGATANGDDDEANLLHHQLVTSPLLTYSSLEHHTADFPSRGLLGTSASERVYFNTNTPSSAIICGVQGSGKSHTVSCLLESALIGDARIGKLPEPLSALVFHFDTQDAGRPCEAAFLSSPAAHLNHVALPQVTILCSPSNVNRCRQAYASQAQVRVEPLCLAETDLTADRMLAIMGCDNLDKMPLYMHTALLIIRNMGVDAFSYQEFKRRIALERLSPQQKAMIELRLHLLDAFLRPGARQIESYFTAGGLVIVDLTDPFLDGLTASVLFDIVLGSFTQWQTACGKVVVLDEAHKYLVNSDQARLNQSISNMIRLQRHLATRIIIATQEPTVVPPTILDLASIIVCHRFSSPAWCSHLARHVSTGSEDWYKEVMALPTGHALVFSPAAALATDERGKVVLLGRNHLRLRVRPRLTLDGGASILAVSRSLGAPTATSSSVASQSLLTPPISEAHLPASTSNTFQMSAPGPAPAQVAAAPSPLPTTGPSPTRRSTPELPDKGKGKAVAAPKTPVVPVSSSVAVPAPRQRVVPARLKHLKVWLEKNSTPGISLKLKTVYMALRPMLQDNTLYSGASPKLRWKRMWGEAVDNGLIEVTNTNLSKKQLKARGEAQMIRLLERGPVQYTNTYIR
ncbi:hypothetical protein DFH08DRAFT_752550 [Mycena albidolilacea]|uniref:AAA+ ATPase domain-containing protein n=1 Tax=Mycena albidolilacea TaxID=1033008 RepID=A0AAD6ZJD1_9AGAR|nr:hypothetical protein DFH08DRAFT_752550 [Mycena albidolilacea]